MLPMVTKVLKNVCEILKFFTLEEILQMKKEESMKIIPCP